MIKPQSRQVVDNLVIKIYVVCHKQAYVPKHPLLVPIQVGAALTHEKFEGMIYDNNGDNISLMNRSYCELTAQYWAWKNDNADYYGFFHYRRYLSFRLKRGKRPYILANYPNENLLNKLCYNDTEKIRQLICKYDIIMPLAEEMNVDMNTYYGNAAFHHAEDLQLLSGIIDELFPEYMCAFEKYMSGTKMYPCNIFIMKKQLFNDYCNWLFKILSEYDNRSGQKNYTGQEARVNGYLAERLLGVYYTWLLENNKVKSLELQRIDFQLNTVKYVKRKFKYLLLPPNSRRTKFARDMRGKICRRRKGYVK